MHLVVICTYAAQMIIHIHCRYFAIFIHFSFVLLGIISVDVDLCVLDPETLDIIYNLYLVVSIKFLKNIVKILCTSLNVEFKGNILM